MSKYNFDELVDRTIFHSAKWGNDKDVISLTIADTDFVTSNEVRDAVKRINEHGRFGYTDVPDNYYESYIKWFSSRYGAKFTKNDCLFSTGIVASLDSILKRIVTKEDKIMMFTPSYNVFFNVIRNSGASLLECPFIYKDFHYEIDYPLFDKLIKEAKVFILCNPHNPNGYKFNKDEIHYINEKCKENNVYLISDEIHADIDYNGVRYYSTLVDLVNPRLITLLSPGKTFNLAGLHSSIVVIKDKELRSLVQIGLYQDDIGEPGIFSIDPVIEAYNKGQEYVYELNNYLLNNKNFVASFIKIHLPKLHLIDSASTYLLWIDITDYNLSSEVFCDGLLNKYKVALAPGINYGDDRFVRINIATSLSRLKEAFEKIESYLINL